MRFKICFLTTMLFLIATYQNACGQNYRMFNKPEVFFENIYIGDDLETCLAKGAVQYRHSNNKFKLNNNIVNKYFYYSDVRFDERKIIKEAEMKFHQSKSVNTAEEVFSLMTQYFCQHYRGMKTEIINEDVVDNKWDIKYRQEGMRNIWETNNIKIILVSYNIAPDYNYINSKGHGGFNWGADHAKEIQGKWVELNIIAK